MRVRKLIGVFAILGFLTLYVVVVSSLGDHIPDHWLARLAYFGLAGIAWGIPIVPLISWMSREP